MSLQSIIKHIYSTAQKYLVLTAHENCIKTSMHMHAIFSNALKKHTWKKLISMYEAVFRFTLCLTLNGVLDLQHRRDSDVGDIKWFFPKVFGISTFLKWFTFFVKKKEKGFWPAGYLFTKQTKSRDVLRTFVYFGWISSLFGEITNYFCLGIEKKLKWKSLQH